MASNGVQRRAKVCKRVEWCAVSCKSVQRCAVACNGMQWYGVLRCAIVCNGGTIRATAPGHARHRLSSVSLLCVASVCVNRVSRLLVSLVQQRSVQWCAMENTRARHIKVSHVCLSLSCSSEVQWCAIARNVCKGELCNGVQECAVEHGSVGKNGKSG